MLPQNTPRQSTRRANFVRFIVAGVSLVVIFTILALIIEAKALLRLATFRADSHNKLHVKDIHDDLKYVTETKQLLYFSHFPPETFIFDHQAWQECRSDPGFFRMYTDPKCLVLWLYHLERDPLINADRIVGVMTLAQEKEHPEERDKAMSNGGVRMHYNDSSMGYWKPCTLDTGKKETYVTEIVSFWIDRFMGFFHTPATVPRYFSRLELLTLAHISESLPELGDPEAVRKLTSFLNLCGSPKANPELGIESEGSEGAMIGWVNLQTVTKKKRPGRFVRFKEITTPDELEEVKKSMFDVTASSPPDKLRTAIETVSVHMFALLVGNMNKFDHNLFMAVSEDGAEGPFIYIDNDRSQWRIKGSSASEFRKMNALGNICKFPSRIAHRVLLLRPGNPNNGGVTLGKLIYTFAMRVYEPTMKNPLFSEEEAIILDKNVDYLASLIEKCVDLHGEENVFLPESWPQPEEFNIMETLRVLTNGQSP